MPTTHIALLDGWLRLVGGTRERVRRIVLWTLLLAVLGALLAAWQAWRSPTLYQVEVTLAVYPDHYRWIMDPHLQTLNRPRNDARNMAMVMAKGPDVLNAVIKRMGDRLPEDLRDRTELGKHLVVRGGQGLYVYLTVAGVDRELAQELARVWAEEVELQTERTFYRYDSDIPVLQEQLLDVEQKLKIAEKALEAFRARTGLGLVDESRVAVVVSNERGIQPGLGGFNTTVLELGTVNKELAMYRHARRTLEDLVAQVKDAQVHHRPVREVPLEWVDDLAPVVKRGYISYEKLRALGDDYDAIVQALNQEIADLQPAIQTLEARSQTLQGQLSSELTQMRELLRQQQSVEVLYKALLTKQHELKAEAAVASNFVDVLEVREPAVSGLVSVGLHAVAGFILGGFLGFALSTTWYAIKRS
ncbi:MAG: hypothetical protein GXO55_04025 [Chloroflexi bacterium]|nr:hypothetical protein [Chloroflexota bacterium]